MSGYSVPPWSLEELGYSYDAPHVSADGCIQDGQYPPGYYAYSQQSVTWTEAERELDSFDWPGKNAEGPPNEVGDHLQEPGKAPSSQPEITPNVSAMADTLVYERPHQTQSHTSQINFTPQGQGLDPRWFPITTELAPYATRANAEALYTPAGPRPWVSEFFPQQAPAYSAGPMEVDWNAQDTDTRIEKWRMDVSSSMEIDSPPPTAATLAPETSAMGHAAAFLQQGKSVMSEMRTSGDESGHTKAQLSKPNATNELDIDYACALQIQLETEGYACLENGTPLESDQLDRTGDFAVQSKGRGKEEAGAHEPYAEAGYGNDLFCPAATHPRPLAEPLDEALLQDAANDLFGSSPPKPYRFVVPSEIMYTAVPNDAEPTTPPNRTTNPPWLQSPLAFRQKADTSEPPLLAPRTPYNKACEAGNAKATPSKASKTKPLSTEGAHFNDDKMQAEYKQFYHSDSAFWAKAKPSLAALRTTDATAPPSIPKTTPRQPKREQPTSHAEDASATPPRKKRQPISRKLFTSATQPAPSSSPAPLPESTPLVPEAARTRGRPPTKKTKTADKQHLSSLQENPNSQMQSATGIPKRGRPRKTSTTSMFRGVDETAEQDAMAFPETTDSDSSTASSGGEGEREKGKKRKRRTRRTGAAGAGADDAPFW